MSAVDADAAHLAAGWSWFTLTALIPLLGAPVLWTRSVYWSPPVLLLTGLAAGEAVMAYVSHLRARWTMSHDSPKAVYEPIRFYGWWVTAIGLAVTLFYLIGMLRHG